MIDFMAESSGNLLGVLASDKLDTADYREVLVPRIELLLNEFCTINVLFLLDENFTGWSPGAAWANTVLDVKHRRDFDKVAIVGAPRWEEWCVKTAASLLMRGELRTYGRSQLTDAWEWLRAAR
jgi:SpoIIAA-like